MSRAAGAGRGKAGTLGRLFMASGIPLTGTLGYWKVF